MSMKDDYDWLLERDFCFIWVPESGWASVALSRRLNVYLDGSAFSLPCTLTFRPSVRYLEKGQWIVHLTPSDIGLTCDGVTPREALRSLLESVGSALLPYTQYKIAEIESELKQLLKEKQDVQDTEESVGASK